MKLLLPKGVDGSQYIFNIITPIKTTQTLTITQKTDHTPKVDLVTPLVAITPNTATIIKLTRVSPLTTVIPKKI